MIKVICTRLTPSIEFSELILNKVYDARDGGNVYSVYIKNMFIGYYDKSNFITLAEFRENRINSILND